MNSPAKLSPMTSYCIRRLIQNHQEQFLKQGIVLSEKELSEPEEILNKLALGETDRLQRIQNIEVLARTYQSLSAAKIYPAELKTTEQQIFATLGLLKNDLGVTSNQSFAAPDFTSFYAKKTIKLSETFVIIESLLSTASKYLGSKIASDYLISTCPNEEILFFFEIQKNHKIKMNAEKDRILIESDLENIKIWIKSYIKKCSEIIHGFHNLVDKEKIKSLNL